ncbi:hypothetical protein [Nitrosopumilus oxyclinae]|uniref:hypothetical protein n=1 Tax=Nitrosopumilus oxyclinae TaxID=1959104 RepID=UPI0015C96806|nr:hypothetical protein [Nitrosopumilus oxyclinae]
MNQITIDVQSQQSGMVESESKKPFSTSVLAMDLIGLTWIFKKDEDLLEELK